MDQNDNKRTATELMEFIQELTRTATTESLISFIKQWPQRRHNDPVVPWYVVVVSDCLYYHPEIDRIKILTFIRALGHNYEFYLKDPK